MIPVVDYWQEDATALQLVVLLLLLMGEMYRTVHTTLRTSHKLCRCAQRMRKADQLLVDSGLKSIIDDHYYRYMIQGH